MGSLKGKVGLPRARKGGTGVGKGTAVPVADLKKREKKWEGDLSKGVPHTYSGLAKVGSRRRLPSEN